MGTFEVVLLIYVLVCWLIFLFHDYLPERGFWSFFIVFIVCPPLFVVGVLVELFKFIFKKGEIEHGKE